MDLTLNLMRYPKHLILDLKASEPYANPKDWQDEFLTKTQISFTESTLSDPLKILKMPTKSLNRRTSTKKPRVVRSEPSVSMQKLVAKMEARKLKPTRKPSTIANQTKTLTSVIFDIHFLRKERLYTKLKYSRCPQYDIVSGGFAALFAGFIGFLISEKFGIELVDSGDFYTAFMYGVFGVLSLRPLIRVYSKDDTPYTPVSPKYLLLFIKDLSIMLLKLLRLRP